MSNFSMIARAVQPPVGPRSKVCQVCHRQPAKGLYCKSCLKRVTNQQLAAHITNLEWEKERRDAPGRQEVSASYGKPKFTRERPKRRDEPELNGTLLDIALLVGQLVANGALDGIEAKRHLAHLQELRKQRPELNAKAKEEGPQLVNRCRCCGVPYNGRVCEKCQREEVAS